MTVDIGYKWPWVFVVAFTQEKLSNAHVSFHYTNMELKKEMFILLSLIFMSYRSLYLCLLMNTNVQFTGGLTFVWYWGKWYVYSHVCACLYQSSSLIICNSPEATHFFKWCFCFKGYSLWFYIQVLISEIYRLYLKLL